MSFWEIFWSYSDTLAEHGIKGFSLFSLPHILWLLILIGCTAVYASFYRCGDENRKDLMRKALALFLIFFEIFKQCVVALIGTSQLNHLPIEICSMAEYVILINSMWPKKATFNQTLFFEFLPAAVIALMVPTVTCYPPYTFFACHQFIMHGAIVTYIIARYSAGEFKPRYVGIWQAAIATVIQIIPIYLVDKGFGVNFMFLTYHENNPVLAALWNISGGNGGFAYLIALTCFVILIMHIWFAGFIIFTKITKYIKKQ